MRRWRILTAIVFTLMLLFTLSCSATETMEATPADEPAATSEPDATGTPTEEAMEDEPTETPTEEAMEPSPTPAEEAPAPAIEADALSGLDSYRAEIVWSVEGEMAQEMTMEIAETREPQARQISLTTQGETFEIISIEDQTWIRANGVWQQLPGGGIESFLGGMTFIAPEDVSDIAAEEEGDYEFVGREEINGVPTRHYRFAANPEDVAQATDAAEVQEVMGDVWVTDDPDLPAFAMRLDLEYQAQVEGQMRTTTLTWEVKEVNSGLTIEPPEEM
ncbi:MAG: hypothetical protein ACP5GX_06850 [Anaerolineae bacterium]